VSQATRLAAGRDLSASNGTSRTNGTVKGVTQTKIASGAKSNGGVSGSAREPAGEACWLRMHEDTCVVIPVHNEEATVTQVVKELAPYFPHIVCVDDGSVDDSARVLAKTSAKVVKHPRNQGQGAALRTGIQKALKRTNIKYVVTFDADGQHSAQDADRMVQFIKLYPHLDVVLGSRFLGTAEDIGLVKLSVLKLAIVFSNLTCGLRLTDTHNGLRVFNRTAAENLRLKSAGMAHASEIIYKIAWNNWAYHELPVTIRYTGYSKGKGQSIFNSFNIAFETVKPRTRKSWRA
jgi:glycosyltransferase involved in cell wall biosynthesis